MSMPLSFDDEVRAELLCYLVVGEFVAMAQTGDRLKTGNLVEPGRIWTNAIGARCDWQEGVAIARLATDLAPDVLTTFDFTTEKMLAPLFKDGWRLDYRQPVVCAIHDM